MKMKLLAAAALAVAAPLSAQMARPADSLIVGAAAIDSVANPQKSFDAWTATLTALKAEKVQRRAEIANAMRGRADALLSLSRTEEAIAEAQAALTLLDTSRDADIVRAGLFTTLGNGADGQSQWPKARDYHRQAMELHAKTHGTESVEAAASEADLGLELTKLGDYPGSLKALEHSFAVQTKAKPAADPSRLVAGTYLANIYFSMQRQAESERLLRQLVADGQPLGAAHPLMSQMASQLAASLAAVGRPIDAMAVHRNSIAMLAANGTNKSVLADALMGATMASLQLDRPEETEALAAEAAQNYESFGQALSGAAALTQAANAARQLDRPEVALARADKAVATAKGLQQPVAMATALFEGTQAIALAANGRVPEALASQSRAFEVIAKTRAPGHSQRTYAEIELGWLTALNGDAKAGSARIKPIVESMVRRNRELEVARTRVVPITSNLESFGQAVEAAYLAGDAEFGFMLAQVLAESDAGRATLATLAKLSARDPETARRLDRRRELLGQRIDLDGQRLAKITDAKAVAEINAKMEPIDVELVAIDAALTHDFPDFDKLLRPAPETLAAVQQRIGRGEVLIVPFTTYHGFYTFAVSHDRVTWGRSPLSRTGVRKLIERIRLAMPSTGATRAGHEAAASLGSAMTFDRAAAADLYAAIFTPQVAALTDRAKLLSIAADDVMSTIPLSLLPTGYDARAPWLIERVALRVVPAIAALGRSDSVPRANDGFVGIGAPARASTTVLVAQAGATRGAMSLSDFPPLPGAETELRAMENTIGSGRKTLLTGADATETQLRAATKVSTRILVFATHGLVSGEFDMLTEPALLLAPDPAVPGAAGDGLLTASEAATLNLDAEWIVLSACNTASGDQLSAAGYSGLARAFLFAGGRQILASHWPVRDDVSARLTVETIREAGKGHSGPEALRMAMLKLMRDKKLPGASNPALWAPYMIVSR
jgi:CHAT domain-containing protein/tetratricopeptide (TPR) repeat protein